VIHPDGDQVTAAGAEPGGRPPQPGGLAGGEQLDRIAADPRLHLDGHDHSAETNQEIDFVGPDPEVAADHPGAPALQEPGGGGLAEGG
jgi:hypothetical protein